MRDISIHMNSGSTVHARFRKDEDAVDFMQQLDEAIDTWIVVPTQYGYQVLRPSNIEQIEGYKLEELRVALNSDGLSPADKYAITLEKE